MILNVFDYITLVVFVLEILIKWIDGFWIFWDNGWNIFDFSVTAMVKLFVRRYITLLKNFTKYFKK